MCITTCKKLIDRVKILSHNDKCLHEGKYKVDICQCVEIEEVKVVSYLGMQIDRRFSWNIHIDKICKSLRGCLAQFYRLQFCVGVEVLKIVYYALVQSLIRYGLKCYGNSAATHISKIEVLNKKIIKIIAKKLIHEENLVNYDVYRVTNLMTVSNLYKYVIILDNYYKDEYKVPANQQYNFRKMNLKIPFVFNNYGGKQNKVAIPKILNEIPHELRELDKIGKVKVEIKKWLSLE